MPVIVQPQASTTVVIRSTTASPVITTGGVQGEPGPAGAQGPQGPAGSGDAPVLTLPIGATITSLLVVRSDNGQLFPVDTSVPTHALQVAGIALQSSSTIGAVIAVQTGGLLTEPAWTWLPGLVFAAPNGLLTQNPSPTGWLLQVGRVVSPTTIVIDLEPAIQR